MKQILYFLLLTISLFASAIANAQVQVCGCTNCPLFLPDGEEDTLFLNVQGVQNDNLASSSQGVCGVTLTFDHQYLGDLSITLISPSGQEIQLIGQPGFHGPTDGSTYDINFVPCGVTPSNVFNLTRFDSQTLTALGTTFDGTFWPSGNPFSGGAALDCLEDFNSGPVNGEWQIFIRDVLAIDAGLFQNFEIMFCDPTGLSDCSLNPCGVFAELDGPTFLCEDFDGVLTLDASGSEGNTFVWDAADGGTFDGIPSGNIVNVLTAGTYFLTVSDPDDVAGTCVETATWVIPEFNPVPEIDITQVGMLSCGNPEITLESSIDLPGNQAFIIWVKDGDTDNGILSEDLDVTEPGEYELTVTNILSGCSSSETITITDESIFPSVMIEEADVISCMNSIVTIEASADINGVDFSWEGPNNFSSTDQIFDASEPGIYFLEITDPTSGCIVIDSIEVLTDTIPPTIDMISATNDIDCTITTSTLNITSSDNVSIAWSGPGNFESISSTPEVSLGGTYVVTILAENGCTSIDSIEVMVTADLPDISTVDNGLIDCNSTAFELTGNSTTPNATFEWTGPNNFTSTQDNAGMVTDTGTYVLIVTAPNGCSTMNTVFVDADTLMPTLTLDPPAQLGCGNTTTTLTGAPDDSGFTFMWSGPNGQTFTDAEPTIEGPGPYDLIVTGDNGCTNSFSVLVDIDDTMPDLMISPPSDLLTCTETDLSLINTSDPDLDYEWSGPNGFSSLDFEPTVDEPGEYSVIVTGSNGCTSMDMVTVQIDTLSPDISSTTAAISCSESVVSISVNSNANIVDYSWTGVGGYSSTVQNPDDISMGGAYTAVITAENGCTNSITFEVTASMDMPDGTIAAASGTQLDCTLTELALSADGVTAGSTLSWLDPAGTPISTDTEIMASDIGIYTLIITSPDGCDRTVDITIDEDMDGPEITANPDVDLLCIGDVSLSISSNENIIDYNWTGPNMFTSNNTNPIVTEDGMYTVVVTGENGCTSTSMVAVVDRQDMPSIVVDPTQTLVCGVDQLTFSGGSNEPNVSLTWTTPNGSIVGDINNQELIVNSQGTYVLTVTNTDNGCTASEEVLVEQDNNTPDASIVAEQANTLNCNITEITLNANDSDNGAGFSFVWGNTGGNDISAETNLETTITEQGTYFITVTNDANQCTSIASVTIDLDMEAPALELSPLEELNCNTTILGIENTATNTINTLEYSWQTVVGGNITTATDISNIEVDMPGTYTVILTNPANGCTSEVPFEVMQNIEEPVISAGQNATLDCGVTALPLEGLLTSNETNIDILWTSDNGNIISGEDTFTPEVGAAGTYTLSVVNNENGCSSESQVTIDPNMDLPVIEFANAADFTCETSSIVLDASTSSSGPGINYIWTSPSGANIFNADGPNPEIFEPGDYILTISNTNNNCESTNMITVEADTLSPTVVVDAADELSCTRTELDLSISSDVSNLDIAWTALTGNILMGETTTNPLVDQAGNYEVIVTSTENQCTASAIVEVSLDVNTPAVAIEIPEELNCRQTEITLDGGQSSSGGSISLLWETDSGNFVSGQDGLNPEVNMPGMYTLTITDDSNGCVVSQSVTVSENMDLPDVNINPPSILNCNTLTTTVQAINMGGSTYEYDWQTMDGNILSGANTLNPEINEDGDYQLLALDTENGCTTTFDITVIRDITPPTVVVGAPLNLTCMDPVAMASGMGSSDGTEFTYSWTDANNIEVATTLATSFDVAGSYTLEIENIDNGCTESALLIVENLKETPEIVVAPPETVTCDNPFVTLSAVDMNSENLEYTWMDANGTVVNNSNSDFDIEVDLSGSFSVLIVNPLSGCDTTISVFVDASLGEPDVEVTADNAGEISCENPEVQLTGTINGLNANEVSFTWQVISGNIVSGENTLNPIVNVQGTYQLMVIDLNNGCSNMSEVNITQDDAIPLATLNQPEELNCDVLETTLTLPSNVGNIDIVWTLNGTPIPNANTDELVVTQPGNYSVLITNLDNGCNSMDMVTITQDIVDPIIDAGLDFELQCNIPEIQIQGSSDGNPNNTILWDVGTGNFTQGENTVTPTANAPGTYTLTVTNEENGCISTDEVNITQNQNIPFDLLIDTENPLCLDDLGGINIIEVLGGEGPYTYSIDAGDTFSDETQFSELEAGDYQVAILDMNGCPFVQDVSIESAPAIGVDLPTEIELLLGDSATISANLTNIDVDDIQSIRWTPSSGLSCSDCLNPTVITNAGDINYQLEVTLGSGCSAFDNIQLRVDRNLDVYVPNAFSPYNLDSNNDEFFLFARDRAVTNIKSFAIYDRWGTQVFLRENIQPNDPSVGWRGEFRDEPYNPGVFIYVIEVEFRTGNTEILKGNVTVME